MPKGPWIKIAPPEEATGDLKRAYERVRTTRGHIPEIRAVMAGEPLVLEGFAAFYPDNNYLCTSIDRRLAEMIATVSSVANGSGFGGPAHARQLAKVTGDQAFSDGILRDYRSAGLDRKGTGAARLCVEVEHDAGGNDRGRHARPARGGLDRPADRRDGARHFAVCVLQPLGGGIRPESGSLPLMS